MKKRKIKVDIKTDSTGTFCSVQCRYAVGYYCDAFRKSTPKLEGSTGYAKRCQECKDAEVKL